MEWLLLLLLLLALVYLLLLIIMFMSQSNRSGKASRTISGAASTEDPGSLLGPDCSPSQLVAGSGSSLTGSAVTGISAAAGGSHDGSLKGKGTKTTTRWSGLFGSTYKVTIILNCLAFRRNFDEFNNKTNLFFKLKLQDTKMDLLAEQLNEYSRHGIPRLPHLLTFEADEDTEEALYR